MRSFLSRRIGLPVWALALIVVAAIGIGGAGGSGAAKEDPEQARQLASAQVSAQEANARATDAEQKARDKLEVEFATKAGELAAREQKLTQAETAAKASTIDGDGVYEVGVDIQPGKWKTSGEGQSCYWETTNKGGDIIDNDNVTGPTVVVIPASAFSFTTKDCGTWHKTG